MNRFAPLVCPISLLLLTACSEAPKKPAEAPKPAAPVTGRSALFSMYTSARGWSADIPPIRLNSIALGEVKAEPGKAGAWEVLFVSPRLSRARSYTYSVIEAPGNLHKGFFAGPEQSWSPGRTKPFLMSTVKFDSDEAYKISLKKGADYDKKNPGKTISFVL